MHLPHTAMYPETWGLDHRTNLTDPHAMTMDAAKILPCNWATMVADREVAGEEAAAEGTFPMDRVMRTVGLMTTWGVAIALMARVIPVMTGEILEIDLS